MSDPSNKIKISQNQVYESIIWDICFVTVGDIYVCVDINCIGYISNNFVVVQNDSKCPTVKSSGLCASGKFTIFIFHPSVTLWTGNTQKMTKGMFQKKKKMQKEWNCHHLQYPNIFGYYLLKVFHHFYPPMMPMFVNNNAIEGWRGDWHVGISRDDLCYWLCGQCVCCILCIGVFHEANL